MGKKICIIQTGTASSEELMTLCAEMMPEVSAYQIIDDSLLKEISAVGGLTGAGQSPSESVTVTLPFPRAESSSSRVTFSILPRRVSDRYSEAMSRSNRRVILSVAALAAMTTSSPSLT